MVPLWQVTGGAAGRSAGVLVMKARGYIGTPAECHLGEHVVAFEVSGHCMTGDGINDGDFVIVDPDQPVAHGDIAVFIVRTEKGTAMMIKRLDRSQGVRLVPSNPAYQAITINHEDNLLTPGQGSPDLPAARITRGLRRPG
jgi:SOS-response transcriptional repressor LexA